MKSNFILTWKDVNEFVDTVYSHIKYSGSTVSGVYGIPRGGLVLAVMLSHKLNVPLLAAPADNCIIVDDICDSGETISHYISNSSNSVSSKNYHIITLCVRKNSRYISDITSWRPIDAEVWVQFPWEVKA